MRNVKRCRTSYETKAKLNSNFSNLQRSRISSIFSTYSWKFGLTLQIYMLIFRAFCPKGLNTRKGSTYFSFLFAPFHIPFHILYSTSQVTITSTCFVQTLVLPFCHLSLSTRFSVAALLVFSPHLFRFLLRVRISPPSLFRLFRSYFAIKGVILPRLSSACVRQRCVNYYLHHAAPRTQRKYK